MRWFRRKLRGWLGITALDKKTTGLWWDINDGKPPYQGFGIKDELMEIRGALDLLIEQYYKGEKPSKLNNGSASHSLSVESRHLSHNPNYRFKEGKTE